MGRAKRDRPRLEGRRHGELELVCGTEGGYFGCQDGSVALQEKRRIV